ncbi:MAG: class I SAM-dependent DNA methyltransferase [Verrucomicrobiae bacterium]|nr:class I SAM-dependent DNA methyltransferase [Verrucomicrobiae bacterium]
MPGREKLAEFISWCSNHITGDEKGQAQIFLDRLFQAFGQPGCLDVGGHTEFRIRKADEDGGGTAFADYVWKPIVLIEMKKRGENLQRHYRQAFDYWTRLVPNRPRYVVLCNFDEFRVYDFDTDLDTPKDTLALKDLPERWGPLEFLAPGNPKPHFDHDRVEVTTQAADKLADCFKWMLRKDRKPQVERAEAQRFILQMLVALFAEDIDLLPKHFVTNLLDECTTPADSYELLGGLFRAMNQRHAAKGGRYKEVPYFNGGLFANPAQIEIQDRELVLLREAAKFKWNKVQPEIFGTLFQHSMDDEERHAFGAHFTHPSDIMKIVKPTITDPWSEQIESAKTFKRLRELRDRMHTFRVLDPACGSGNFLYIAYRELKRLEARIYERIDTEFPKHATPDQIRFSYLSAQNFYGLDILPFAVEIAKVTMMIGRKLAIDELHITEPPLPLDNLDNNFIAADALLTPEGLPAQWPKADVIIGNPPFLGSRYFAKEHGYEYVRKVHAAFPDVPKMADFCVYWFRKAADHLPACTADDPVAGRAGLVGTQNIRNNESRVGGLDHVVKDGTITEAVDNQPWSGEAKVHVSIANWIKTQDIALLPKARKLWFKVPPAHTAKKLRKASNSAAPQYELDFRECEFINAALSDETDVGGAVVLAANAEPKRVFQGQNPVHEGFKLSPEEADSLLRKLPDHRDVLFPYLIGLDLVTVGTPTQWVIDFGQRNMLDAAKYSAAFEILKTKVMPDVLAKAEKEKITTGKESTRWTRMAERWWQFRDWMPGTMAAVLSRSRYIVCPRVTKRPTFAFVSREVHPDGSLSVFAFDDDYSFGVLQSSAHWAWFIEKCSKLKSDFRYTSDTVFDTFPWPQFELGSSRRESAQTSSPKNQSGLTSAATIAKIDAVAAAAREVRHVRAEALRNLKGGLRALYRTLELPGANPLRDAHAALDAAVLAAYGFSAKQDLLAQLLALNLAVAAKIERGEPVTAPGVPPGYPEPQRLLTTDCIRPTI